MNFGELFLQKQNIFGKPQPQVMRFEKSKLIEERNGIVIATRAKCKINCKVLSAAHTPADVGYSEIIMLDVVIAWHSASFDFIKDIVIAHPIYSEASEREAIISDYWFKKVSHIHIMYPKNSRMIEELNIGDTLEIEGYLADLINHDGSKIWLSDLNFTDGMGRCETIYALNWRVTSKIGLSDSSGDRVEFKPLENFKPKY